MTNKNVSRRDFIKITSILAVGFGVWGCASSPKSAKKQPSPKISRGDFASRDDYDVVVIGTGMGGSAAGAIAAHHGLKTLILEKNPRPGGSCSYYEKQGFHIDTGAHMFIRANKGPMGDVTRRLGMGTPIPFTRAENTVKAVGINRNITIPQNFFLRGLTLPSLVVQMKINPIHYMGIANLLRKVMVMTEKEIERLDNVNVDDFVMKYTSDQKTRAIMGAVFGVMAIVPPWKASAGEAVWNIQKMVRGMHVSYPKGGAVTIPKTFLSGAESYGAEIRMNSGVKKIIVKDGKVDHVVLPNGEKVKTRTVISTSSAKDTVLRMTGEDYFPAPYVQKVKSIFPSFTAVQAKLALKKELVRAGALFGFSPVKTDRDVLGEFVQVCLRNIYDGVQGNYIPIYAPVPTSFDKSLAPPGCQIITAVAPAPTLDVEWKDSPEVFIEGLMKGLREVIPNLDENIIFCDTWTIETMAAWVGKSDGSAITTGQVVGQTGKNRIGHKTPVKGLYLAGDCAGPARGVGTELATQSGIDCADLVANEIRHSLV